MTDKLEQALINGAIAALGILAVGIKAIDAANAWVTRKERLDIDAPKVKPVSGTSSSWRF